MMFMNIFREVSGFDLSQWWASGFDDGDNEIYRLGEAGFSEARLGDGLGLVLCDDDELMMVVVNGGCGSVVLMFVTDSESICDLFH
ncbi:hypothetical protein Ddye_012292 [Dipteronia dyeriana]|uniref:Uncharacterized protein n=1 Tax=Dipteronia dyeriana TaxID=168575 RepID=A0AAE0CIE9_9ROSI|nr:hypothetical protein Ddye_012292 [Dipteronia dyeriana]